jgi:hypothetical protein
LSLSISNFRRFLKNFPWMGMTFDSRRVEPKRFRLVKATTWTVVNTELEQLVVPPGKAVDGGYRRTIL